MKGGQIKKQKHGMSGPRRRATFIFYECNVSSCYPFGSRSKRVLKLEGSTHLRDKEIFVINCLFIVFQDKNGGGNAVNQTDTILKAQKCCRIMELGFHTPLDTVLLRKRQTFETVNTESQACNSTYLLTSS